MPGVAGHPHSWEKSGIGLIDFYVGRFDEALFRRQPRMIRKKTFELLL
jgi:hypothetical protein